MRNRDDHIDKLFREKLSSLEVAPSKSALSRLNDLKFKKKLSDLEVNPSAASWSKLQSSLATDKANYKWYWAAAAIIGLAIVSIFAIQTSVQQQTDIPLAESIETTVEEETTPRVETIPKTEVAGASEKILEANEVNTGEKKENTNLTPTTVAANTVLLEVIDTKSTSDDGSLEAVTPAKIKGIMKPSIERKDLTEIAVEKNIPLFTIEQQDPVELQKSFKDKLKNTWARIRNTDDEDKLIDIPKARDNLFAMASSRFQKLKINRNNDDETDD